MVHLFPKHRSLSAALVLCAGMAVSSAEAAGSHYGWCIGVGNHHGSDCSATSSGGTGGGTTGGQPPTSTQLPTGQTIAPTTGQGGPGAIPYTVPLATPNPVPQQVQQAPTLRPVAVPSVVPQRLNSPQQVPQQVQQAPTPRPVAVPPLVPQLSNSPQQVPQQVQQARTPRPVAVPPLVPQLSNSPQQVPQQVQQAPTLQPVATPSLVPQLFSIPQRVPQQVQQTPTQTPVPTPQLVPRPVPTATTSTIGIPPVRPGGTGQVAVVRGSSSLPATNTISHAPSHVDAPNSPQHVTDMPGRQKPHALPRHLDPSTGEIWDCTISGHGRRIRRAGGNTRSYAGAMTDIDVVDAIAKDLPARHPQDTGCLVSIKRRHRN